VVRPLLVGKLLAKNTSGFASLSVQEDKPNQIHVAFHCGINPTKVTAKTKPRVEVRGVIEFWFFGEEFIPRRAGHLD
jgi:hypothetical protein